MSYTDLGGWCKDQFILDKVLSNAPICQWLKPEKRKEFLAFLATETCSANSIPNQESSRVTQKWRRNDLIGFVDMRGDKL